MPQRSPRLALTIAVIAALGVAAVASGAPIAGGADVSEPAERGDARQATDTIPAPTPQRAVLISDSQMAALHWSGAKQNLTGTTWELYLEGCRRLASTSCYADRPHRLSVKDEILDIVRRQGPAGPSDVLVVATGYNDFEFRFVDDFNTVVRTALDAGFNKIAWLTYTELRSSGISPRRAALNDLLLAEVGSGRWPNVVIWDFNTYSAPNRRWFEPDGVHLTVSGAEAAAAWLSEQVVAS